MKALFSALLIAAAITLFCACSDDDSVSTNPSFEELTLTPTTCYGGDTLTAVVTFADKGSNLYMNTYYYSWNDGVTVFRESWDVIAPTSHDNVTFLIPVDASVAAGTYIVTFGAETVRYSSHGENGTLYGSANTVSASFTILSNGSSDDDDEDE